MLPTGYSFLVCMVSQVQFFDEKMRMKDVFFVSLCSVHFTVALIFCNGYMFFSCLPVFVWLTSILLPAVCSSSLL